MSETERPPFYPVMLDLVGRSAVVVGGGPSALRAATALASHGADVVVISPTVSEDLRHMERDGVLKVEPRGYVRGDLDGAMLVVAASGSAETDAAVSDEARARNVLINVQTDGAASSFIVPSVVQRGDLQIAVSTGGKAPVVARQVKRRIAYAYDWEWGSYVALVADLRALAVQRTGLSDADLAPLFTFVADSDVLYRIRSGQDVVAEDVYRSYLESIESTTAETGGTDA
jgi:precorrin-2 dehydrogenase / sirohydrochlorin ferrochelatase